MFKLHLITQDFRSDEEKLMEKLFGAQEPQRPHAYLVGRNGELIACSRGNHQTEILRNPTVWRYIPWAERANAAIQKFYQTLNPKPEIGYWERVTITSPLDHEIVNAWYAAGGLHLSRHKLGQEDPELWELTGLNPKPAAESLTRWLEVEQPLLDVPQVNIHLTVLPATVPANALEFPKRLEPYTK